MPSRVRDEHDRRILQALASSERITQRSLAKELGIALGLTNLLLRRLAKKGYLRVSKAGPRHVRYLMTGAGRTALATATRVSFANTLHLYTETREAIRASLATVSSGIETPHAAKRVVFYGAGDVAEIAFISLQSTDLTLVGVVDDFRTGRFLGFPIRAPSSLLEHEGQEWFDHVIITSIMHTGKILPRLEALPFPMHRVSCILRSDAASD